MENQILDIRANELLRTIRSSEARVIVNEGGSRSGKTYATLQDFVIDIHTPGITDVVYDVVRKTMPALRATAMRDFFSILRENDLYNPDWHNKTESIYRVAPYNNEVAFYGLDQPQKVRGRPRNKFFANEANELTKEDYLQLRLRTSDQMLFDYNPSEQFHWLYDDVLTRNDCQVIHSTFRDNKYLDPMIVAEIEALEQEDPAAWNVYGLGNHGVNQAIIYTFKLADEIPEYVTDECYGLDIGFTNPTCLVDLAWVDEEGKPSLYAEELIYERRMHNADLVARMEELDIDKRRPIYVDTANAQTIDYLNKNGYLARQSDKSVDDGIRSVISYNMFITKRSANLQKEARGYRRKTDRDGNVLESPVKFNDHGMDALRYGVHTHFGLRGKSWMVS